MKRVIEVILFVTMMLLPSACGKDSDIRNPSEENPVQNPSGNVTGSGQDETPVDGPGEIPDDEVPNGYSIPMMVNSSKLMLWHPSEKASAEYYLEGKVPAEGCVTELTFPNIEQNCLPFVEEITLSEVKDMRWELINRLHPSWTLVEEGRYDFTWGKITENRDNTPYSLTLEIYPVTSPVYRKIAIELDYCNEIKFLELYQYKEGPNR